MSSQQWYLLLKTKNEMIGQKALDQFFLFLYGICLQLNLTFNYHSYIHYLARFWLSVSLK